MSVRLERLSGPMLASGIPDVARLRMAVFRDWPYLYEGDPAYEQNYLAEFANGAGSIIVAAYDGDELIGAATGSPLGQHTQEFSTLFAARDIAPETVFYCGESVLLLPYRGQGIGHAFFDYREGHACHLRDTQRYNFTLSAFCSVIRARDDPRCPAAYRPLDTFWHQRGYRKAEGMIGHYDWREIGDDEETRKLMQFWIKELES